MKMWSNGGVIGRIAALEGASCRYPRRSKRIAAGRKVAH
jgi:hypothetical protein